MIDSYGLVGLIVDYAFIIASTISALIAFFYAWSHNMLGFDEEAKQHLFEE